MLTRARLLWGFFFFSLALAVLVFADPSVARADIAFGCPVPGGSSTSPSTMANPLEVSLDVEWALFDGIAIYTIPPHKP